MKTIIAGCRTIHGKDASMAICRAAAACGWLNDITEVVSGAAPGIDLAAARWAKFVGIPLKEFLADWDLLEVQGARIKYHTSGRAYNANAGKDRNREMAEYADALIAIWDGASPGTKNMIEEARKRGLRVFVWRYGKEE